MNYTDIISLIIIIIGIFLGYKKGFISSLIDMISLAAAIFFGILLQKNICSYLDTLLPNNAYNTTLALVIPTVFFFVLYYILMSFLKRAIPVQVSKHLANKLTGIIPGIALSLAMIYACLNLNNFFFDNEIVNASIKTSRTFSWVTTLVEMPEHTILPTKQKTPDYENVAAAGHGEIQQGSKLPFKSNNFSKRTDLELLMLDILNKERNLQHLPPFAYDKELTKVATAHSGDMLTRGYFAHNTPEGVDPFMRMRRAKIIFSVAGENLAISHDLYKAHTQLMLSPEHRANILNPAFGRIGIGILDAGEYGLMISQEFRN
ncbi:CvpA family protein [Ferruginibacter sp. SUN002]|uniref:CvpA family protein n=1 Tax=Ferruginibacter sp. SUN002 TaxID=2937789 RepID=UPI003D364B1A